MQRLTLAQQIAQLEDTAPADFDPEDIYGGNANDHVGSINVEDVDMEARDPNAGREHYVDMGPSGLRKLRDSVADPKYDGVKTSRHQLHAIQSDDEEVNRIDGPSESETSKDVPSRHGDSLSSTSEAEEDEDAEEHDSPGPNGTKKSRMDNGAQDDSLKVSSQQDEALTSSLRRTRVADKLKGKAVSRQLVTWDSLVDARIRLQKSVIAANKLPRPENIASYVSTPTGRAAARLFLTEALQLSEELFELRHSALAQAGSVLPPRKKRRIKTDRDDLDLEALVEESTAEMVAFDAETHSDTLLTLQKWSSKVQAVAPSALLPSSRVSFKTGPVHVKSAAELVEDALKEQEKAVKRTWGKANQGSRIGGDAWKEEEDEEDEEAFDDRDFYQAMLRDVIESKGGKNGVDAADLYANSKSQKKKKIVDTKASKGRKLRYEPHEKLQNFMVPVPVRGAWHEEQIDELFASLLGKGFEGDGVVPATTGLESIQKESEALQGFRIFG